jgi:two-component system, cell cycle sensor histidine kinase and response regulator CckA
LIEETKVSAHSRSEFARHYVGGIPGGPLAKAQHVNSGESMERAILAALPDLIFELSANGVHRSFHAPQAKNLWVAPSNIIGRSVHDVLPAHVAATYQGAIDRTLATGEMQIFEYQLTFDGPERHDYEARMVRKSADEVLVVVRDITEKHALEERLRQSQKMDAIGRLAGGIAHDFNNLLTVINGYTAMILDQTTRPDTRELLDEVAKAGQRAAALTRQLLTFSRQQMLEPRVLQLNAVIADTERMLRRIIGEDIELDTRLGADLPSVRIDPGQVEQVLVNLSVNARDAMSAGGGRLTITTGRSELRQTPAEGQRPGEYVSLSVTDTGIGMTQAVRARIFEPFFTTKAVGTGTGLGLAVVFGIARQNGGFVEVDSEIGRGTTVRLFLPAAGDVSAVADAVSSSSELPRGNETLLLVEDDAAVRALTARILEGCGYTVMQARDGREAIEVMQSLGRPLDLLLTDVVMPRVNGRELAEVTRQILPRTRVIFMSGYTDDDVLRRGVQAAEVTFLMKPFTARALAERVRQELDRD